MTRYAAPHKSGHDDEQHNESGNTTLHFDPPFLTLRLSRTTIHGSRGNVTRSSAVIGPSARNRASCAASFTSNAPAKASALIEIPSKNSLDRGTSSSHCLVTSRL